MTSIEATRQRSSLKQEDKSIPYYNPMELRSILLLHTTVPKTDWEPIFHSTVGYRKIQKHSLFLKPIVPTPKSDLHTSKSL